MICFDPTTPLPPNAGIVDHRRYLLERARGARIVHLGCVDDRLTEARAGTGQLLHEELAGITASLVGVDNGREGLAVLERLVPGDYRFGDVEHIDQVDLPGTCDLVIASEIIEHLSKPLLFLECLRDYLARTGATALITTPNALSWRLFFRALVGREEISHPDHVVMYSPVTLSQALQRAGLTTTQLLVHNWTRKPGMRARVIGPVDAVALRRSP